MLSGLLWSLFSARPRNNLVMITIKTSEEIEILRAGGRRHAEILNELAKRAIAGVSTNELNTWAIGLLDEGGDYPAFLGYTPDGAKRSYPAALCVSINDEIVHGIPNENPRILKEGDVVSLDLGLSHKGMITDSAMTLGVGKISPEEKRLIKATREALGAGILAARAGNSVGDIGFAIENVAKKYGLKSAEGLSGHGVGYEVHEDPYVPNAGMPGSGPKLKAGMVLAIEPMFVLGKGDIVLSKDGYTYHTKDGQKAAHFEHTIAITNGAPIILTAL